MFICWRYSNKIYLILFHMMPPGCIFSHKTTWFIPDPSSRDVRLVAEMRIKHPIFCGWTWTIAATLRCGILSVRFLPMLVNPNLVGLQRAAAHVDARARDQAIRCRSRHRGHTNQTTSASTRAPPCSERSPVATWRLLLRYFSLKTCRLFQVKRRLNTLAHMVVDLEHLQELLYLGWVS